MGKQGEITGLIFSFFGAMCKDVVTDKGEDSVFKGCRFEE